MSIEPFKIQFFSIVFHGFPISWHTDTGWTRFPCGAHNIPNKLGRKSPRKTKQQG